MIEATQQSLKMAEPRLAGRLHCPPDTSSLAATTVAEHIRATLFGAFQASGRQTIHTTRLLANARRALLLAWPRAPGGRMAIEPIATSEGFCNAILRNMADIGDLWEAGRGQWLPTPLQLVRSDDRDHALVLGTAPLSLAEQTLNASISCGGPSRFVDPRGIKDLGASQTVDAWLGAAPPLNDWTTHTIATIEARMEKVGGLGAEQLEIYAPDVMRSQRRNGRWVPAAEVGHALSEPRICRPRPQFAARYDRPHYLAHFAFQDGGLSLQRQALLPREVSLRLRFGLDARLGTPRQITIAQAKETFAIDKPLALPTPESRAFALGWLDRNAEPPSERLTFHNDALHFVLHALGRLSIAPARVWRLPA